MVEAPKRVAIIGGGVTGSCAANHLQSLLKDSINVEIVLFDQGGRGPGGRASHRRVRQCGETRLSILTKNLASCGSEKHFEILLIPVLSPIEIKRFCGSTR
jgi:NAD(P)-binding Rossmann-like domain